MSKVNTTDEELAAIETSFLMLTNKFAEEGFNLMACAAVMSKLAMMMYKTSLSPEDYNLMIDTISDSRNQIKTLDEYSGLGSFGSGRLN